MFAVSSYSSARPKVSRR